MAEPQEPPPSVEPNSPEQLAAHEGFRRSSADRPLGRERLPGLVAAVIAMVIAGLTLLAITIAADPAGSDVAIAAIGGLVIVGFGAATMADLLRPVVAGWIALVGGTALAVGGLVPSPIELEEFARIISGAILFMAGAAILASSRVAAR